MRTKMESSQKGIPKRSTPLKKPSSMLLSTALEQTLLERDICDTTEAQYRKSLDDFSHWLGRPATIEDLSYTEMNGWLKSLKKTLEATTINNKRKGLTVVWNYLADLQLISPYQSSRLFHAKEDRKPVVSWTISDFRLLIEATEHTQGETKGIPNSKLLLAWLWVGFDTAFRPSDMRLIKWQNVDFASKTIAIVQHKTRQPHKACLSDESIKSLESIRTPKRDLVFPVSRDEQRYPLKKLYAAAKKLGFQKLSGRSIGTLRKLHATIQYEDFGAGIAAESLGHVGGTRTVLASYVDHRSRKQGRTPRHDAIHDPNRKTNKADD